MLPRAVARSAAMCTGIQRGVAYSCGVQMCLDLRCAGVLIPAMCRDIVVLPAVCNKG